MLFEKISQLCDEQGLSVTTLCKELTGSSGNLPTWKKDNIRPETVTQICTYFNVSADYLLGLTNYRNIEEKTLITSTELDSVFKGLSYPSRETIVQITKNLISCTKDYENLRAKKYVDSGIGAGRYLLETIAKSIAAYQSAADYLNGNKALSSTIYKLNEMLCNADQSLNFVRDLVEEMESVGGADSEVLDNIIYLRHAVQPVSAGTGTYVTEECMEKVKVAFNKQTARADFCVTVSGKSMEPKFHDGDILLVHEQPDIEHGEFGIFVINDEGFVKQRGEKELISLNPKYENIPFYPDDDILCGGKVIGILNQDSILL